MHIVRSFLSQNFPIHKLFKSMFQCSKYCSSVLENLSPCSNIPIKPAARSAPTASSGSAINNSRLNWFFIGWRQVEHVTPLFCGEFFYHTEATAEALRSWTLPWQRRDKNCGFNERVDMWNVARELSRSAPSLFSKFQHWKRLSSVGRADDSRAPISIAQNVIRKFKL